jgi:hypothetical protein
MPIHNVIITATEIFIYVTMPILYFRAIRIASEEFRKKLRYERQVMIYRVRQKSLGHEKRKIPLFPQRGFVKFLILPLGK